MKILAVIISYYPDEELLKKNIKNIINDVDNIIIWENTPSPSNKEYRFYEDKKIKYIGEGKNLGISYGLNYAWRFAKEHNYDYILTMDQDTIWHNFHGFIHATVENDNAPLGIYSPSDKEPDSNSEFLKVNFAITSGMLLSLDIVEAIGGWCNKFKVDGIDNELCCNAISKGINIYIAPKGWIVQRCGIPVEHHLGKHTFTSHNYSAKRLYGIYKNHIISFRHYKHNEGVQKLRKSWLREWFRFRIYPILFERQKFRKLLAIFMGILSGITYRLKKVYNIEGGYIS